MMTVRSILQTKGNQIWTISPETLIIDALKLMAEKNIGALLVTSGEVLAGVFSERDYARKVMLRGESSMKLLVKEIMSTHVFSIRPEQSIEECMSLMTEKHIRHLPVLENGKLAGMISIGDVVKAVISEQKETISHLENYITGKR